MKFFETQCSLTLIPHGALYKSAFMLCLCLMLQANVAFHVKTVERAQVSTSALARTATEEYSARNVSSHVVMGAVIPTGTKGTETLTTF